MIVCEQVRRALTLTDFDVRQAQRKMAPVPRALERSWQRSDDPKLAAVLVLLFPDASNRLSLVLQQRNKYPGVHSGQISLPGGRREDGESFLQTALRETHEEVGVPLHDIELLGKLTPIYIPPSDFEVHPFVGYVSYHPQWVPELTEVTAIIEMPLDSLLDDTLKKIKLLDVRGFSIKAPFYDVAGHEVWGATAIILAELEGRLRQVLD